ncbi:MAG: hypothetical protein ACK5GN_05845 [Pseudomonadota bacterium]|jgi:hypothetical protein
MKPATTIADNGAFSVPKLILEFALRAQKITILGALTTQFHEISGLVGTRRSAKVYIKNGSPR